MNEELEILIKPARRTNQSALAALRDGCLVSHCQQQSQRQAGVRNLDGLQSSDGLSQPGQGRVC